MAKKEGKPVNMIALDHIRMAGEEQADVIPKGTVMERVPADLAIELAGTGKARPATPEELAAAKKAASDEALKGDPQK